MALPVRNVCPRRGDESGGSPCATLPENENDSTKDKIFVKWKKWTIVLKSSYYRLFLHCSILEKGKKHGIVPDMPTPTADFSYELPHERIAQTPVHPRDSAKLLTLNTRTGAQAHKVFADIVDDLRKGDVLVFNSTKVFRARLVNHDRSVEIFVLGVHEGSVEALIRPGKKFAVGSTISVFGTPFVVESKADDGVVKLTTNMTVAEMFAFCEAHGEIPTPPYVEGKGIAEEEYQTVYAQERGSVAAPTAGLHFTPELVERLKAKGVQCEYVLLHVGLGTFRPVQSTYVEDHTMHAEWGELTAEVAERINQAKREGRRIIAVGTTTVRLLEAVAQDHAAMHRDPALDGALLPYTGMLNIFIRPGFRFRIIDGMITNFHLPQSTLLMLVCAFGGKEQVFAAYAEAIKRNYRFFSFGDAMFLF